MMLGWATSPDTNKFGKISLYTLGPAGTRPCGRANLICGFSIPSRETIDLSKWVCKIQYSTYKVDNSLHEN